VSDGSVARSGAWVELPAAGLWARALRTAKVEVAFFKHLFESYEEVALVRTAATVGDDVILAVVAPPDFTAVADEILLDVARRGSPALEPAELPESCREDWFLEEWA
jgi:hypothetical protein